MNKKLISSALWAVVGQGGYILVGLIGTVVLARLLTPNDFGVVGIAMFFVGISNVLVESGMGGALIRKEDATERDYSTIFLFNLMISAVLVVLLILGSSFIADYYNLPELGNILIVLSSILIINAFTITQNAKLIKEMKFKARGVYKVISLVLAVVLSIVLAYKGYGLWAIVALQVLSSFFFMVILWLREGWIKTLVFSKKSFKEMVSFGVFTTAASLLNAIFDNIYQLILGKYFSVPQVGFYYQAKKLQEAPDTVYKLVILQVVYSHLSKLQNKYHEFKESYNTIAKTSAMILGLTTCLTYIYANEIILLVLGSQWTGAVFYLRILVIVGFFTLQEMVNRNIFKVYNETHKIFYLEILKKIIQSVSIAIGVIYADIELLLYGFVLTSIFSYFVNFYYSRKIVDGVSKTEISTFLRILLVGIISSIVFQIFLNLLGMEGSISISLFPIFIILYLGLLYLMGFKDLLRYKAIIFKK